MDPKNLTDRSVSGSTAATGLNLFGDLFKGLVGSNMYGYQAGIAQMKEKIATENANYTRAAGETEAGQYGLKARVQAGQIVARQAAGNVDVGKGSARVVQDSQHQVAEMDLEQIRLNAGRKAYGYDVEAAGDKAQESMYKSAAGYSLAAIPFNMASSLITGSSSVASKWLQAKQYGIYNGGNNAIDNYVYGT